MPFLQLKQKHNITTKDKDRSINVQLQIDPNDVDAKENKYNKLEFIMPCKNIGSDYVTAEAGSYTIYSDKTFDLTCSQYLMKKIMPFSKGDCLNIAMIDDGERTDYNVKASNIEYDKPPEEVKTVKESKYGYDSVKERDTDRRLDILWGMAFNNATRLVAAEKLHDEVDINERVKLIDSIMPKMYEIAKGLTAVLEQEQKEQKKEDEDDLPF
tara:strand:+ start:856 stop:1491 length:636 start_codon:yes stop_codon:yes gene_type:complete